MKFRRKVHEIDAVPYTDGMEDGKRILEKMQAMSMGIADIYASWSGENPYTQPISIPFLKTPRGVEFIAQNDMIVTWAGARFPMAQEQFNAEYEPIPMIIYERDEQTGPVGLAEQMGLNAESAGSEGISGAASSEQ